uniref:L1 transposable element RRM domain-containing protein n=1 Tax=Capra hircus TaxID=9925 RepID=A0A452F5Q2_CAPHI
MKRQRNTQQVKEQESCPPNQTKVEEVGNLPEKEFRILIVKMIQNLEIKMESQINRLETRIEKMQERFNKDLEEIKKSQNIMNNAINEIRNTLEATISRIMEAEDRISEIEDRMVEINESERKQEKRIKRNEDNLRDLQDNMKRSNIRIIGVPEEEEDRKKDHEKILEEIIVENFPKMGKEIITQVQETQRVPNRINPRRNTPRHILIKLTKIKHKEQILKAAREKQQITHKGIPIRITADLSIETLQARREWQDILKVMKDNNLQPRLLYPARISFKYEGDTKSFTDKQKLREFSTTKPALQQILKDIL